MWIYACVCLECSFVDMVVSVSVTVLRFQCLRNDAPVRGMMCDSMICEPAECTDTDQYWRSSDGKQATVAPQPAQEAAPPAVPEVKSTKSSVTYTQVLDSARHTAAPPKRAAYRPRCVIQTMRGGLSHTASAPQAVRSTGLCSAGKALRSGHLPQPRGGPHTASP